METDRYRVKPGTNVKLPEWATKNDGATDLTKTDSAAVLESYNTRLGELQEKLYADGRRSVLVVLQGMDTSGKDGTIRHVFGTVNPQGVRVVSFKTPNDVEARHDYLWRTHHNAPIDGQIMIFNRSHYEDVLVVRVHDLVPKKVWSRRYEHIVNFEQMLVDEGTVIRKFFLHIDNKEQRKRIQARIDDPEKNWKLTSADFDERKLWDDYQQAYEPAIAKTSTEDAPWYVVPANQKWYRNLVISKVLIETLEGMDLRYPEPAPGIEKLTLE